MSTARIATIASAERGTSNATHCPGPAPRPINKCANRFEASSSSRYETERPSQVNATAPGVSNRLWELEQPAAAVANGYFVVANNRVGLEDNEYGDEAVNFYGSSYAVGPDGNFVGDIGSQTDNQLIVRDLDLEQIRVVRERWQFFRDRRPDQYGPIVAP